MSAIAWSLVTAALVILALFYGIYIGKLIERHRATQEPSK